MIARQSAEFEMLISYEVGLLSAYSRLTIARPTNDHKNQNHSADRKKKLTSYYISLVDRLKKRAKIRQKIGRLSAIIGRLSADIMIE